MQWDEEFLPLELATNMGDQKYKYVPFHGLSENQKKVVFERYPNKMQFKDEHYYYPVSGDKLGPARRVLAIPVRKTEDKEYMSKIGYVILNSDNTKL